MVDHTGRSYAFRHALTRDAVYEDMLPGERAACTPPTARRSPATRTWPATTPRCPPPWPTTGTRPWTCRARCPPRSPRPGTRSSTFAPAEAQRHLERALEIWPRVPDAEERTGLDQAEVARLAGEAAYQAGAIDRSLSLFDQALAGLPAEGDAVRRALVLDRRARAAAGHRPRDLRRSPPWRRRSPCCPPTR